jgi:ferritin-like metal-binding protein YciE
MTMPKSGWRRRCQNPKGQTCDAGLIAAANRVLQQTLQEEKKADQKLTQLAESMVNEEALRSPVA